MSSIAQIPIVQAFRQWQDQSRLIESIQIVFVVGPPKCGTTWVQTILDGHPNALARGEGHFATRLLPKLTRAIQAYHNEHRGQADESARSSVAPHLILADSDVTLLCRQAIDRALIRYIAAADWPADRRLIALIDKTPDHARHIPALATLYPWAKFICVTRDVRDAAVSAWFHRQLLGTQLHKSIDDLAPAFAHDVWGAMMRLARTDGTRLGPDRYTEVTYENLKASPDEQVERLFRFVGLPAESEHVTACIEHGDFERQCGRAPGQEAASFHRKGVVGDWESHLSPEVAQRTLQIARQMLASLPPVESLHPMAGIDH